MLGLSGETVLLMFCLTFVHHHSAIHSTHPDSQSILPFKDLKMQKHTKRRNFRIQLDFSTLPSTERKDYLDTPNTNALNPREQYSNSPKALPEWK
ncbi:hypothetical protein M378DRAFT_564479 [Amanita muscaria Koide BX008]|uniref:Uncharacterized protein n=1 Tax=Amanita muscaria (strain Koide BX008) TaxID=946122 RepID=A0A0C2WSX6_AMAMK|nr:hypothetical protein M378DRAFT_564479 [Amanita muscaria Koide BX008]